MFPGFAVRCSLTQSHSLDSLQSTESSHPSSGAYRALPKKKTSHVQSPRQKLYSYWIHSPSLPQHWYNVRLSDHLYHRVGHPSPRDEWGTIQPSKHGARTKKCQKLVLTVIFLKFLIESFTVGRLLRRAHDQRKLWAFNLLLSTLNWYHIQ